MSSFSSENYVIATWHGEDSTHYYILEKNSGEMLTWFTTSRSPHAYDQAKAYVKELEGKK